MLRWLPKLTILVAAVSPAAADTLVLPVFAHNAAGSDGARWSSELYLTNPSSQAVQVSLLGLLPGRLSLDAPRVFMAPTRVVPPRSAVVWSAAGLAVDLGGAREALGGLVLSADGPVRVSSRIVRHTERAVGGAGFLVGGGQELAAIPLQELPRAGSYLLPALLWDRQDVPSYVTRVGFTNPGVESVPITLDVAGAHRLLIDGDEVSLPHTLEITGESWRQLEIAPAGEPTAAAQVQSFDLEVTIFAPLAFYASVVDSASRDPRTVLPVELR
jgi:hypothetical protein